MPDYQYDLVVIGSGPAGQKAAICAAKLRKHVLVSDRRHMLGGASLHTGTIPSKTLREAILYLSGFSQRSFYRKGYSVKDRISVADLAFRVQAVVKRELEVVRAQLKRNDVDEPGRDGTLPRSAHRGGLHRDRAANCYRRAHPDRVRNPPGAQPGDPA